MPTTVEKLSIALPPEMAALVREAVEGGEYASSSEVIRDALRAWKRKRLLQRQGLGHFGSSPSTTALLLLSGPLTAAPLLLFAECGKPAAPAPKPSLH